MIASMFRGMSHIDGNSLECYQIWNRFVISDEMLQGVYGIALNVSPRRSNLRRIVREISIEELIEVPDMCIVSDFW